MLVVFRAHRATLLCSDSRELSELRQRLGEDFALETFGFFLCAQTIIIRRVRQRATEGSLRGESTVFEVKEEKGAVVFSVRVQPRASRDAIGGEWNGALKLRLTAPPVDDRANEACRRLLAEYLNIPLSAVRILSGERSRTKRVEVRGVTADQVRCLLPKPESAR